MTNNKYSCEFILNMKDNRNNKYEFHKLYPLSDDPKDAMNTIKEMVMSWHEANGANVVTIKWNHKLGKGLVVLDEVTDAKRAKYGQDYKETSEMSYTLVRAAKGN